MNNTKSHEAKLQMTQTTSDSMNQTVDSTKQSTPNGVELIENPMSVVDQAVIIAARKPFYKKNSNAEFSRVESCIIEV